MALSEKDIEAKDEAFSRNQINKVGRIDRYRNASICTLYARLRYISMKE